VRHDPVFATPALSPDALRDRTVIITGASDGIGRTLAERCARAAAHVVMVGRNEAKTRHAASELRSHTGSRRIDVEVADLLHLDEQHALGDRLRERFPRVFALVNNAGALFLERQLTRDGLERTFALNHLAYVTLSVHLLPSLLADSEHHAPARIVNVASRAHMGARLDLSDLQGERRYSGWRAYGRSKLANILFTRALARRVDRRRITVHAVHPGLVASRFAVNNGAFGRLQRRAMDLFAISSMAGSDTAAWLLGSPEGASSSGEYWVRRERVTPSRAAQDDAVAEALWTESIRLGGLEASCSLCREQHESVPSALTS
jgi:NAD(P)-dependent dehydrogenase (short-subunit alcohol dehydrogenase family)